VTVPSVFMRRASLGAHVGKSISAVELLNSTASGAGAWWMAFNDMALVCHTDTAVVSCSSAMPLSSSVPSVVEPSPS
jgi:hypothetical protein